MIDGIKKAGGISFGVSMMTDRLGRDVKKARTMLGGFVNETARSLGKLTSMFGGVGALSAGSLAWGINQSINRIDQLNASAKTLGTTTDALSRLGFVASQTKSSQESLIKGLARVGRTTDDVAVRGVREMVDLYDKLGVNAKELAALSPDQQFLKIGEAIGKLGNQTEQLVATQRIFGRSSGDLVNVFRLERSELEKLTVSADKFGITIGQKHADRISDTKDSLDKLAGAWEGLKNEMAIVSATPAEKLASATAQEISGQRQLWRYLKSKSDRLNQMFGDGPSLYAPIQYRKNNATGKSGSLYSAAGQSQLGVLKNLLGTPQQIWEGLSGPLAKAQRQLAVTELDRAASSWSTKPKSNLLGDAFQSLMQTGMAKNLMQIGQGIKDSPIAQLQRQLFGANLQASMAGNAQRTRVQAGSFDAVESGSLAAYQQRIRGQQQFSKVEVQQLKVQERIADGIDLLADKMPEWGVI